MTVHQVRRLKLGDVLRTGVTGARPAGGMGLGSRIPAALPLVQMRHDRRELFGPAQPQDDGEVAKAAGHYTPPNGM